MTMTYAQPLTRRYTRARLAVPALWRQVIRSNDKTDVTTVAEPDRSAYTQLEIYDGVLAAFERRDEVAQVLRASADRDTAVRRLRAQFDSAICRRPHCSICRSRPSAGTGSHTVPRNCAARSAADLRPPRLAANLRSLRAVGRMEG